MWKRRHGTDVAKPRVLVCVLTGTERQHWINPELCQMLRMMDRDPRFAMDFATVKDAVPHEVARNTTVKLARDHKVDWLISFDNDNFMTEGTPLDVLAAAGPDKNVIGLTYGVQAHPGKYHLYPTHHSGIVEGAFEEVGGVAGGVLMVNRRVWEAIPSGPWFRWQHGAGNETLDRGEGACGEDAYFCELVRRHGFRVWTHTKLLAGHYRTTNLTRMVCTMGEA